MSLFTRVLARGCGCACAAPSTSARARIAAVGTVAFHTGGAVALSRARVPRDARAAADLGRERAAELARGGDDDDAYDDDPLVHMGRTNKSELKRRAREKKDAAKTLLRLPRSQIERLRVPEDLRGLILEGLSVKGKHGAMKRHEGALAKRLRSLRDDERETLETQMREIETGVSGTIDPRVEALALSWRDRLLDVTNGIDSDSDSADSDAANAREEVFQALALDDVAWTFTRQDLKRALAAAETESRERAEKITAFNALVDEEMKIFAFGETDPQVLAETRAFVSSKIRAKSGEKKLSNARSRALLVALREIATVVVDR